MSAVPAISPAAGPGTAPRRHSATMTAKSSASIAGCSRHHWARLWPVAPYIPAASARFRIPHMRPITGTCGLSCGSRKNARPARRGASSVETPRAVRATRRPRPAGVDGSGMVRSLIYKSAGAPRQLAPQVRDLRQDSLLSATGGRQDAELAHGVGHVEHDPQPRDLAVSVLVEIRPVELHALAGGRQPGRVENAGVRAVPVPPEGGLGLAGAHVRSFAELEAEVRKGPPRVVEELAHVGVPAHRLGPRGVVVHDVLGHEREQPVWIVRVPGLEPALRELPEPFLVEILPRRRCLLSHGEPPGSVVSRTDQALPSYARSQAGSDIRWPHEVAHELRGRRVNRVGLGGTECR